MATECMMCGDKKEESNLKLCSKCAEKTVDEYNFEMSPMTALRRWRLKRALMLIERYTKSGRKLV